MIFGGLGGNDLSGTIGNDVIYGGVGNDTLAGTDGNDSLFGDGDNDTLFGGSGNDTVFGGQGDDVIFSDADPLSKVTPYLIGGVAAARAALGANPDFVDPGFADFAVHYFGATYSVNGLSNAQVEALIIGAASIIQGGVNSEILWTEQQIASIEAAGKQTYLYLNVAKLNDFQGDWQRAWTIDGTTRGAPTGAAPPWLGDPDPNFLDARLVKFWEPGWKTFLQNRMADLIALKPTGIFLDDVLEYFFRDTGAGGSRTAVVNAQDMRDLIIALREEADRLVSDRDGFLDATNQIAFIVNGAPYILSDGQSSPAQTADYLAAIDIMFLENYVTPTDDQNIEKALTDFGRNGIPLIGAFTPLGGAPPYAEQLLAMVDRGIMPWTTSAAAYNVLDPGWTEALQAIIDANQKSGADSVVAGTGNDYVDAGALDDSVDGGSGNDTVLGGPGNDTLAGGVGSDVVYGGDDDDMLIASDANDGYFGGAGSDTLDASAISGDFNLTLIGQNYGPLFRPLTSTEHVIANDARNVLFGNDANNTIQAVDGNDIVAGGRGADVLYGGDGLDRLFGNNGNDTLFGGDDNDKLEGNAGADHLDGGAGSRDIAEYFYATAGVVVDLSNAARNAGADAAGDTLVNIEDVAGGAFDDEITGDGGTNLLYGRLGNDTLDGGASFDWLDGSFGDDRLIYRDSDAGIGGAGADTFAFNTGGYQVVGDFDAAEGDRLDVSSLGFVSKAAFLATATDILGLHTRFQISTGFNIQLNFTDINSITEDQILI